MPDTCKIAMVAALEREVRPLIKHWRRTVREFEARGFEFFEHDQTVLVCGGIGAEAARRATEAIIALYHPSQVMSVGFAGALDPALGVGAVFSPRHVVDATDGSRVEASGGQGVLVTFAGIAGAEQKAKLARAYQAQAVDMEAAAVARAAQAHGLTFAATKAISDELGFEMPAMDRFIGNHGQFRTGGFVAFSAIRPWLWPSVFQLARNSGKASKALCRELRQRLEMSQYSEKRVQKTEPELHPISKATN